MALALIYRFLFSPSYSLKQQNCLLIFLLPKLTNSDNCKSTVLVHSENDPLPCTDFLLCHFIFAVFYRILFHSEWKEKPSQGMVKVMEFTIKCVKSVCVYTDFFFISRSLRDNQSLAIQKYGIVKLSWRVYSCISVVIRCCCRL